VPNAQPTAAVSPASPLKLALKYKILLQRGNETFMVPESFVFTRGDRFRIIFEGNATGQFASVLREVGALTECELMLRYDGMPFTGEEIARRAEQ